MDLDPIMYKLPVLGKIFTRMYQYFRTHTLITNTMHVSFGLGLGFLLTGKYQELAMLFIIVGVIGHAYAYMRGK